MSNPILYEQPLNERIRVFLRLEHLFHQLEHFQSSGSVWDSHAAVSALIEILTILDRSDLRSEILKELDRHVIGLSRLRDAPTIDQPSLDRTLETLRAQLKALQNISSKPSTGIRENDLLNGVRQRTVISGGTCGFDIPAYHFWLNQSPKTKTQSLARWLSEISPLEKGIALLLKLTRESALFESQQATNGFYQRSLDAQNPCQLLRIALAFDSNFYPEVSGNKHRVNVRFLTYTESGRAKQLTEDLEFRMSCCGI